MPPEALLNALHRVVQHRADLTREEARAAMEEILEGKSSDAQIAAFAATLAMKGETVEELVGFAEAIRSRAALLPRVVVDEYLAGTERDALVDTCGTGGDASGTFNISTATAFTVAGAGVRVAKHGNRSVTSQCGSADVLEQLGVRIDVPPRRMAEAIREVGIGFLFAPAVHGAMKYAAPARRQLRLRTVFNMLGPLTNPAGATVQIVGVYDKSVVRRVASALFELGVRRGFVVHGEDGLDEITITSRTFVAELHETGVECYYITPEDFGVPRARLEDLSGGDAVENAALVRAILGGEPGPRRDVVLVNAAAALLAAARALDFKAGVALAARAIDSGAALGKLHSLAQFSQV
jgi:anthranilate phosphoribosyltransferase